MDAETKTSGDEVKKNVAERSSETVEVKTEEGNEDLSRILENESPLDSVVKPFVEALTQEAESLVQNVTDQSSSYITQVEKEFENLASSSKEISDENAGESSEAVKSTSAEPEKAELDEKSRTTHTQPFVAVTAATRASWTNCCGLLDVLRPSDQ